ncbi:hypothetical protein [Lysinibacillus sp. Ag94]|nr:hypothetical protein [Lysinibacillus sp. Ag94]
MRKRSGSNNKVFVCAKAKRQQQQGIVCAKAKRQQQQGIVCAKR